MLEADISIRKLCDSGEKVIESEYFRGVNYMVKNNHIIVLGGNNGNLAISFESFKDFITEIKDIFEEWKDVHTDKCLKLTDKRGPKPHGKIY